MVIFSIIMFKMLPVEPCARVGLRATNVPPTFLSVIEPNNHLSAQKYLKIHRNKNTDNHKSFRLDDSRNVRGVFSRLEMGKLFAINYT